MTTATSDRAEARPARKRASKSGARRLFWMQQMRLWHWISSAVCLASLLLFAVTGFTLNHAAQIEAKPKVETHKAVLPAPLLARIVSPSLEGKAPLPAPVVTWLERETGARTGGRPVEWSEDEASVSLPRPGGDAWVTLDRRTGAVEYEKTARGAIALLNDLHKGRNSGPVWSLFIDVFAFACLLFTGTGLVLLALHSRLRVSTWPLVAAGVAVPLILAVVFLHL
ncbi:PepSY-associated TM helix domain-containing protein [soil metagenome]